MMAYDEKTAERVRKQLAGRKAVTEKPLMGGVCFMLNGNMCCAVSGRGGLLVRVGPDAHEKMLQEPHTEPMEMRDRVMKGYVRVAPDGYRSEAALKKWLTRGVDFTATLKGKAANKRAPRAAKKEQTKVSRKKRKA
jgi:TfoX/Sxy family transcriptional regulator of competence genes